MWHRDIYDFLDLQTEITFEVPTLGVGRDWGNQAPVEAGSHSAGCPNTDHISEQMRYGQLLLIHQIFPDMPVMLGDSWHD